MSTSTPQADAELQGRLLESLKERSSEDLAELCAELLLTYVVRRRSPTIEQLGTMPVPKDLREMSFVQLVAWLKRHLSLPELDALEIQHGAVHAKVEGRLVPLRAAAPASPEPAPPPARAPRPGPPPASSPADPPAAQAPAPAAASAPALASEAQAAPDQESEEGPSDRFSMLEID